MRGCKTRHSKAVAVFSASFMHDDFSFAYLNFHLRRDCDNAIER
jgi:hypothetical protein